MIFALGAYIFLAIQQDLPGACLMAVLYMDLRNAVLDFGMGLPGSIF